MRNKEDMTFEISHFFGKHFLTSPYEYSDERVHIINQNHAEIMCNSARDILINYALFSVTIHACAIIIQAFGLKTRIKLRKLVKI